MTRPERDPEAEAEAEAVRVYRRTLGEVARTQVVAEAEDILCDTWIDELERFRAVVLDAAACASRAEREQAAPAEPLEADEGRRPGRIAGLEEACEVLAALDEELEHVCLVGLERTRRGRADLARLRAAWFAAYGSRDG